MDIIETGKMEIKEEGPKNVKFTINLTSTKNPELDSSEDTTRENYSDIEININTSQLSYEIYH